MEGSSAPVGDRQGEVSRRFTVDFNHSSNNKEGNTLTYW